MLVAFQAATHRIADPDVGWILAAGRQTIATHAAPVRNGFSFTAPDTPWIMHEWLLGVLYASLSEGLGWAGFALVAVVLTTTLGALVLQRSFATLKHPVIAGLWAATIFVFGFDRLRSARPIAWSLVLACALVLVALRPRLGRREVATAVLLTWLWANLHGSFPLALLLLAAAAFDAVERRGHLTALVASALVTLVNPYGAKLHLLVLRYALGTGETRAVHERVLEFSPIWRAGYHDVVAPIEIALVVAVAAVAASGLRLTKESRGASLVALLLALGAFVQARNAGLAIVLGGLLVQPAIAATLLQRGVAVEIHTRSRPWLGAVPAGIVGGLAFFAMSASRSPLDWVDPSLGGAAFGDLAGSLPENAKTFVPFRSGGLLLDRAARRGVTTFYDSRNDCYPEAITRVALALKDGELPAEGLAPLLQRYGTEYAIVPSAALVRRTPGDVRWSKLALLEPALSEWSTIRQADGWLLLRRVGP